MRHILSALLLFISTSLWASEFALPAEGDALIGEDQIVIATHEDTLIDIARRNGLGYQEIINANPSVDAWLPKEGTSVKLPLRFLIPDAPRDGLVINVAEMRLYYFPKTGANQSGIVKTYPISVGRSDWNTPVVTTKVTRKAKDPVWYPPKSVRSEHAADGDPLPAVVKAGPDNPLGQYALYLGIPSYLIHGTNRQFGIGMQVTHGCMRLYPEDIQYLYENVKTGTAVRIVNQPYKVGWSNGVLYLEVHPLLEGAKPPQDERAVVRALVEAAIQPFPDYRVDWGAVDAIRIEATGEPEAIGPRRLESF